MTRKVKPGTARRGAAESLRQIAERVRVGRLRLRRKADREAIAAYVEGAADALDPPTATAADQDQ